MGPSLCVWFVFFFSESLSVGKRAECENIRFTPIYLKSAQFGCVTPPGLHPANVSAEGNWRPAIGNVLPALVALSCTHTYAHGGRRYHNG